MKRNVQNQYIYICLFALHTIIVVLVHNLQFCEIKCLIYSVKKNHCFIEISNLILFLIIIE